MTTPRHALAALALAMPLLSCPRGKCEIDPNPNAGVYTVRDSRRPELVGATVSVVEDTVTIRYTLPDGSRWKARYRVEDAYTY